MTDIVSDEMRQAIDHIERNGSLAWMDKSTPEVERLYGEMERKGYLTRNPWSDRMETTPQAKRALGYTKEIEGLLRL